MTTLMRATVPRTAASIRFVLSGNTRPLQASVRCFSAAAPQSSTEEKSAADATPTNASPGAPQHENATASAPSRLAKPIKNLRDVMEALDILVEEAEKKVEKKYRPNMFAEFKQLNDTEGKVLPGAVQLLAVDKARTVPSLTVKSLLNSEVDLAQLVAKNGKHATLVLTSFKNFGLEMLPAWRAPFQKEFVNQNVQVVTLSIIEDWYMKLVHGSIVNGLKDKTPPELHDATYAYFGRCDEVRTAMDLYNSFVGYVHLVDSHGRIRWIAGGPATADEIQRLIKVTRELLVQQKQNSKQRR